MSNDRYAPPVAVVGEVTEDALAPRPRQVVWAVWLLWITTLLSLPLFVVDAMRMPSTAAAIVTLVGEGLCTAFFCYVYVCIHRGRNWARILTLVFTVLGTATVLLGPAMTTLGPQTPETSVFERALSVVNTVSDIACMYLLFAPPGAAWFRRRAG